MKKVLCLLALSLSIFACTKEKPVAETPAPTAKAGEIKYTLDGTTISGNGGGYSFQDTAYFVKHETNEGQLSLYFNGTTEGTYSMGNNQSDQGKGFISYYPNGSVYNAISGELALTKIEGSKVSGTFTGILQKQGGTETMEVKNGSFTAITAFRI